MVTNPGDPKSPIPGMIPLPHWRFIIFIAYTWGWSDHHLRVLGWSSKYIRPFIEWTWVPGTLKISWGSHMDVSENSVTPKSSTLIGIHFGVPLFFGNTHIENSFVLLRCFLAKRMEPNLRCPRQLDVDGQKWPKYMLLMVFFFMVIYIHWEIQA